MSATIPPPGAPSTVQYSRASRLDDSPERKANQAAEAARQQISEAHEQVEKARKDAQQELDYVKDEYVKDSEVQNARQQQALEEQRMRGYEQLRELKRSQEAELRKTRSEGDRTQKELQEHYRNSTYGTRKSGEEDLQQTRNYFAAQTEYELKNANADLEHVKQQNTEKSLAMKNQHEANFNQASQAYRKEYERMKNNQLVATEASEEHFKQNYNATFQNQQDTLNRLNSNAGQKIQEITQDTSSKLNAYSDRQRDPFYKLVNIDADVRESSDAYILTANIPPHERDRLSVSVRGDQVVISGTRHNEEKLNLGPGRTQSTSSFQSYSESFPIAYPVDSKLIRREFQGDQLVVVIPKKLHSLDYQAYQAKRPDRLQTARPKFPDNLPYYGIAESGKSSADENPETASQKKPTPGSRPLT